MSKLSSNSKAELKFQKVMHEFGRGKLQSHGNKVTDQKQAVAIAFSEARKVNPEYGMKKDGGPATDLKEIYKTGTANQLWDAWDEKQRTHFLIDHAGQFFELMGDDYSKSAKAYNTLTLDTLPTPIRKELVIHHAMGMYNDGGEAAKKTEGSEIINAANKYGWKAEKNADGNYELFNRKGNKVVTIQEKGSRYLFFDNGNNKLMSGRGEIGKSIERLLTQYYFAQPVTQPMQAGGPIPPAKQKLQGRIDTLKDTIAAANESTQKKIQDKIDKLQAKLDYNPTAKQRAQDNKGRFAMDVPAKYSKAIYKKLWSMKIMPRIHKMNGTASIVVSSRNNLNKAYKVYSGISSEKVLPLEKISRKL